MRQLVLGFIFILAIVLRFYNLGEFPEGFHRDEAFLGYNAYSILKTGSEITGDVLPLHFSSYLFSPSLYSYLAIPSIALFGLTEFSVRFPSALFGSLSVPLLYVVALRLFNKYQYKNTLALLSAFFLVIIPWHINLSRTTTENTLVVFFFLLGLFFFFRWKEKQTIWVLFVSFLSFFVTLFLYQAPRAFLPFFLPMLFITLAKEESKKNYRILIVLFLLIVFPIIYVMQSNDLSLRMRSLSLTSSPEANLVLSEGIHRDGEEEVSHQISRVFHNKPLFFSDTFLKNYFSHFTYSFLFTDSGFPDRYRIPEIGLIYVSLVPLLLYGLFTILLKEQRKIGIFLLGWILFSPIGSALTFDDIPNLQRTLFMLPPLLMISSYGTTSVFSPLQKRRVVFMGAFILIILSMAFLCVRYLHQYYIHAPAYRPWFRNAGYETLVAKVNEYLPNYKKAVITNRESAPTIFFLFYSQYDPSDFQQETKNTTMKDYDRIHFGKYEFSQEECPAKEIEKDGVLIKTFEKNILYVNSGLCDEPESVLVLKTIKREDNSEVFHIVSSKN